MVLAVWSEHPRSKTASCGMFTSFRLCCHYIIVVYQVFDRCASSSVDYLFCPLRPLWNLPIARRLHVAPGERGFHYHCARYNEELFDPESVGVPIRLSLMFNLDTSLACLNLASATLGPPDSGKLISQSRGSNETPTEIAEETVQSHTSSQLPAGTLTPCCPNTLANILLCDTVCSGDYHWFISHKAWKPGTLPCGRRQLVPYTREWSERCIHAEPQFIKEKMKGTTRFYNFSVTLQVRSKSIHHRLPTNPIA